jgi:Na+/H+ antiporter NhaD/arsenite permease-like protein
VFVLLKAIDMSERYICIFFATILAISNTAGASTPIGDFPAIIIMTSGITTFINYLIRAMPLFALTSFVLISFWVFRVKECNHTDHDHFAVELLQAGFRNVRVDTVTLLQLCAVLVTMFLTWSFVPQTIIPPEVVAILGYVLAAALCAVRGKKVDQSIDFKSVLTIAAFLFLASVISETGIIEFLANYLQLHISDPKVLLIAVMLITSLVAGIFSAGPAAAAMMPVIIKLCSTSLSAQSHWVAIAYAASICAGSSLFMWSATAGLILSNKVEQAKLGYRWGVGSYLKYGLVNYLIQMGMALSMIGILL